MRLTKHTDYSLRVLLYLASAPGRLVSTEEISDAFGISSHHLVKVARRLGALGHVTLQRGRGGGMRLATTPEEINIGALVRQTEPDFALVECFKPETNTCPLSPSCGLIAPLKAARDAYLAALDRYTLADVSGPRRRARYRELLGIVDS